MSALGAHEHAGELWPLCLVSVIQIHTNTHAELTAYAHTCILVIDLEAFVLIETWLFMFVDFGADSDFIFGFLIAHFPH